MAAALKPDLFHVHEPDLLGPAIAVAGVRPVIWDVHESYLDVIMERTWIPRYLRPAVRRAWDWKERRMVRRCAAVIAVTEPIAKRYRDLGAEVEIVANVPDLSEWRQLPPIPRDGATCVFTGAIRQDRGLVEVVQAISILKERGVTARLDLAGPTYPWLISQLLDEAERRGIGGQVKYHGILAVDDAQKLAHASSIGIVTYLPIGNNMAGWPTKLFEYMAHGLPLVYSEFPMYRAVAEPGGAGIAVDPTSAEAVADAIERSVRDPELARRMGEAGKRAVMERFNWENEKSKLLNVYRRVLAKGQSTPAERSGREL